MATFPQIGIGSGSSRRHGAEFLKGRRRTRPELTPLEPRALLSGGLNVQPTADEQYMLELINRARADPPAEAQRLLAIAQSDPLIQGMTQGWDLNGFIQRLNATAPEPPLAFNTRLIAAARDHDATILATNDQRHSPAGYLTNPAVATADDGQAYFPTGQAYWATGENIFAYTGNVERPTLREYVDYLQEGLMIDWSNPDYGHLANIMAPGPSQATGAQHPFSQVGIGLLTNAYPTTPAPANPANPANRGLNVGPVIVTQEFGWRSTDNAMLVGVAYQDADGDGFYTPGEGLAGTYVQAVGQHGEGVYATTSWDSGGYALALPPGDYTVTANGPNLPYPRTTSVHIGVDNVSWDLDYAATAQADQPVPADYDGDGKTDLSVYRPDTGQWIVELSAGGVAVVPLGGGPTDVPVPADFDGDGKADMAIYRASTGQWFIQLSGGGKIVTAFGGNRTDIPVPADYDGDGKADLAIYRGLTGQWFIDYSSGGRKVALFGKPNLDLPVPGDYDGDGRTDVAVYNLPSGIWTIFGTSSGPFQRVLGVPGYDQPVVADFDGDGKSDIAVYRSSTGQWSIQQSSGGYRQEFFGGSGAYQPLVGHFDGGARANPTLYRPSTGQWILMNAQRINSVRVFGKAGPAPWLQLALTPTAANATNLAPSRLAAAASQTNSGASSTPPSTTPTPPPAVSTAAVQPPPPMTPRARRLLRIAQSRLRLAQRLALLHQRRMKIG